MQINLFDYRRWARSTLVLVPLFGVHYTVFLGMSYSIGVNETVELVWLFCDQLFASFQVKKQKLIVYLIPEIYQQLRDSVQQPPETLEASAVSLLVR